VLDALKQAVCQANLDLVRHGLVLHTFGNASGIDREQGLVVIKPSGVNYDRMGPEHMVVVALESGQVVEGELRPSSDTATHLVLYRAFSQVGGIAHTHSLFATAWAQAKRDLPCLGTTQADYWHGPVPCTRELTIREIQSDYEVNTGKVIVETFTARRFNPAHYPGVLVASHGPFTWGTDVQQAVEHALILEFVARLASETLRLNPDTQPVTESLLNRHFFRKHGPGAYYGQQPEAQQVSPQQPRTG